MLTILTLPLLGRDGRAIASLRIFETRPDTLHRVPRDEAVENGEQEVQLKESESYEFQLMAAPAGTWLAESDIVKSSKTSPNRSTGRIETGLYAGTLALTLIDQQADIVGGAAVEIRSKKLGYRDDYRSMLEAIAAEAVGLILEFGGAAETRLAPDPSRDATELQTQLAFLRSILSSSGFRDAVARIIGAPHMRLEARHEQIDIHRRFKVGRHAARQIAASTGTRVPIPTGHPLEVALRASGAKTVSLPARVDVRTHYDTQDTAENRFVKFALLAFQDFLAAASQILAARGREIDRVAANDVRRLVEELGSYLDREPFRSAGEINFVPTSSPVLLRKPGYREVYRAWLHFNVSAFIHWAAGDDVYGSGQKNVPFLYEYWLFFQLLRQFSAMFAFERTASRDLIERSKDRVSLKVKSGTAMTFRGQYRETARQVDVEFSYNRQFDRTSDWQRRGSWSRPLRPDFTLALWPSAYPSREAAESAEALVRLHFDAKYRVESLQAIFGDDQEDLEAERREQRNGNYKRADLFKMHAYKDAIRRSEAAFIIYPGTANQPQLFEEYHELLPGLGAFAVRPGNAGTAQGLEPIGRFVKDSVEQLADRASRLEQTRYHTQRIQKRRNITPILRPLPELQPGSHDPVRPAAEQVVLLATGYSAAQLQWIAQHRRCPVAVRRVVAHSSLDRTFASASRIVLVDEAGRPLDGCLAIGDGPEIIDAATLSGLGYATEAQALYAVFPALSEPIFDSWKWSGRRLFARFRTLGTVGWATTTLAELVRCRAPL